MSPLQRRLSALGFESYWDYLRSPHWIEFKRSYFKVHPRICEQCGSTEDIQLHHITYVRLGQERFADVTAKCGDCHNKKHHNGLTKRSKKWEYKPRKTYARSYSNNRHQSSFRR